jgi:hypothetical protein
MVSASAAASMVCKGTAVPAIGRVWHGTDRCGMPCHGYHMCDTVRAFQAQRLPPWVLPLCRVRVGSKRGWTTGAATHGCTQADQQLPARRRRLAGGTRVRRTAGEVERRAQQRQEHGAIPKEHGACLGAHARARCGDVRANKTNGHNPRPPAASHDARSKPLASPFPLRRPPAHNGCEIRPCVFSS